MRTTDNGEVFRFRPVRERVGDPLPVQRPVVQDVHLLGTPSSIFMTWAPMLPWHSSDATTRLEIPSAGRVVLARLTRPALGEALVGGLRADHRQRGRVRIGISIAAQPELPGPITPTMELSFT